VGILESLESFIITANGIFWGVPLFILVLGTGLWLTYRLGFIQIFKFPLAIKKLIESLSPKKNHKEGDISSFQALSTALSGTMGIGNLAGVSTAIVLGGPGAIFWMWMTALIGMATKYSEAVLAIKYRTKNKDGTISGGPMYYIEMGLKNKKLALIFAGCGAIATLGGGAMAQANSISLGIESVTGYGWQFSLPYIGQISTVSLIIGILLVITTGLVIIGGIKRIGKVAAVIIPILSLFYFFGGLLVILINYETLPGVFLLILESAFSPYAIAGGAIGYTIAEAIRYGVARGVFTNEAGLGSAPVAYAAAQVRSPIDQGLMAMLEVFIDTIVVCSITAFVVLSTGLWKEGLTSTALTTAAFSNTLGVFGTFIVIVSTILFGYSTILGWSYYGEQYIRYIFGEQSRLPFKIFYLFTVLLGAVLGVNLVWEIADLSNGLMAIPNLVALLALSGIVAAETKNYFSPAMKVEVIQKP
jgi:AGCS family alanine or glycine:cation symporter